MTLKKLFTLLILGALGYWAYLFISENFNQPALAYKRFAEVLLDGDSGLAKPMVAADQPLTAFKSHAERMKRLNGEPRFTWYDFISRQNSADGKTVSFVVRQIVRVDPPGEDTYFGTEVRSDLHYITLVQDQSAWKVASFEDATTSENTTVTAADRYK
ncbi:MAG: hypothetical protein AAGF10_04950 [Verrucomicrobiota bacterium]